MPYHALIGELWDVYYEDFWENWSCYNGTVLYIFSHDTIGKYPFGC